MFVFIHIPKTAGTSLAGIFDYGSGRRILYDYKQLRHMTSDLTPSGPAYKKDVKSIKKHKKFILENFDFIHGHFRYEKYASIFPDAKYMVCLRKPIDRLISHYHHVLDEAKEDYWLYKELLSGNMGLADMAKIENIGNIQTTYLLGRSVSEYDHIFINEKLGDSIYQFQLIHGFKRNDPWMNDKENNIPRLNIKTTRKEKRKEISDSEIKASDLLLEEDNEIYSLALEKFAEQSKIADSRA